jgi:opacity protein-like surface antigen
MRFRCLAATAALCLVPSIAQAEECPDGDWFCDQPQGAAGADDAAQETVPEEGADSPKGDDEKSGPPVVVYTPKGKPKPSKVIIVEKPEPKPPKRRKVREWGFNLHLSGALMGEDSDQSDDAGMGGLGFSFRYRPVRMLAIDAGFELIGGTDWNGYERHENAFLTNAILYLNPRDTWQLYWFGGFGLAGARVQIENETESFEERYSYFGLQTGFGVEARVSKKVAIGGDLLGFVRGRTDAQENTRPEFVDAETHRATNASGGGLIRAGITFYW